jgi:hypothetical protein
MDVDRDRFYELITPLVEDTARPSPLHRALLKFGLRSDGDPCPDVEGMASIKKLKLLNLAVSCLPQGGKECYMEVGTYQGKSLIAACLGNAHVPVFACDNFGMFDDPVAPKNFPILEGNIARYGLSSQVKFFNTDFREVLRGWKKRRLPPIGVYFYDGAHNEESQYLGIKLVEDQLADRAIVIVDDWRFAPDSPSYAEAGTRHAMQQSFNKWTITHVLPARFNGDKEQWWNGVAVISFDRRYAPS